MCNSRTTRIEPTEELLTRLYEAQKERLIEVLQTNRNGDDGGDYITSALDVFQALQTMSCDQSDLTALDLMLNTPAQVNPDGYPMCDTDEVPYHYRVPALLACASDGICDAILELDCLAYPDYL